MPHLRGLYNFLRGARNELSVPLAQRSGNLTFVVGNESADLDSLCSAILLAYLRTYTPPHTFHIPLANIPRADLALRPDFCSMLRSCTGIEPADVLTLDDLPSQASLPPERTHWLLVDHNALNGPLERFIDRVTGCIDHHAEEHKVPTDANPRVIEPCGSCASLVVRETKDVWRMMADESDNMRLARVALAPILVDTVHLTAGDRTTQTDVGAVEFLEEFLKPQAESTEATGKERQYDRVLYAEELMRLKEDVAGMSYRDLLRKDYKMWMENGLRVGISMVMQSFEYLFENIGDESAFLREVRAWAEEQGLDIVVVMTGFKQLLVTPSPHQKKELKRECEFRRQLLVCGLNSRALKVVDCFAEKNEQVLGLQTWDASRVSPQGPWWFQKRKCWTQHATDYSRKKIAPMVRQAMREVPEMSP